MAASKKKAGEATPHHRRVRARLARLVEPARSVVRRARAGAPIAPDQLQKAFEGFTKAREVELHHLTPAKALELMRAFYEDVTFKGRPRGHADALLYQHGTREAQTSIGFVRQLYSRGRGQQLCVDLLYPASELRLESASLWSQRAPTLDAWVFSVEGLLAATPRHSARPTVKVSLERF